MKDQNEFIEYLRQHYRLSESDIRLLLDDVLEYWNLAVDEYVRTRHLQLQAEGKRNSDIYRIISDELGERRFTAGTLSDRQIRRIIYG